MYNNRITVSIGDGCNWGERPMEAAQKATEGFMAHVGIHSPSARTTKDMGRILLEGIAAAHNSVIAGKPEINDAGTTTLIGATIFPMQESYTRGATTAPAPTEGVPESNAEPGTDFGVCIVSIGDCKCFLWDVATKRVRDITCGNRGNITDASDPGGRLGPYTDSGLPDARNLQLFFTVCHTNDLLIFCSDGVHDNLDCSSLGVLPGELCEEFEGMSWVQASKDDLPLAEDIKIAFYEARLGTLINSQYPKHCAHVAGNMDFVPPPFLPKDIADFLADYCMRTTFASRQFMETHPNKKLPSDYKRFPGKMDHTTSVIVRVDNPIKKKQ